jgi:hypothetical protein
MEKSITMDRSQIAYCGSYCGDCTWKEKTGCKGCKAAQGNLFYGECAVAKCAIAKGVEHCGLCPDVPCETLQAAFDNPEHGDKGERLANLKGWAAGKDTYTKVF